jgi:hypothetical protein
MTEKKASSSTKTSPFDLNAFLTSVAAFLTSVAVGKAIKEYRTKQTVFVQGSPAD